MGERTSVAHTESELATGSDALRVSGALHCNLNVVDLEGAAAFYEERVGLKVRMRSRADAQDGTPLGLAGDTASDAWFLFDRRGGRGAPALELVRWESPATTGATYPSPRDVGIQAIGFTTPQPAAWLERLAEAGTPTAEGRVVTSAKAAALDLDGVPIEIVGGPNEGSEDDDRPILTFLRLVCADLETTAAFYELLGFERTGPASEVGEAQANGQIAMELVLQLAGPPPLQLRLTMWPGADQSARAHQAANHRGLFRMALGIPDVARAVAAARAGGQIEVSDVVFIPLPGTPLGGVEVAFLHDPDGVMVELVEQPKAVGS